MKKMLAFTVMAVFAFSGLALAQADPEFDGMSVYLDTDGLEYSLEVDDWTPGPGVGPTVDLYLLVTRPSTEFPSVMAWEARIEITCNSLTPPSLWTLSPNAMDLDGDEFNYVVGCAFTPIPIVGTTVVLATNSISWLGYEGTADAVVNLVGVAGSASFPDGPGYAAEAGYASPCQPIFGAWGDCIWVNGEGPPPIANENMTWSQVKSLY